MSGKVRASIRVTSESVWASDGHGECKSHGGGQFEGQCHDSFWNKVIVRLRIRVKVRMRFSMCS